MYSTNCRRSPSSSSTIAFTIESRAAGNGPGLGGPLLTRPDGVEISDEGGFGRSVSGILGIVSTLLGPANGLGVVDVSVDLGWKMSDSMVRGIISEAFCGDG